MQQYESYMTRRVPLLDTSGIPINSSTIRPKAAARMRLDAILDLNANGNAGTMDDIEIIKQTDPDLEYTDSPTNQWTKPSRQLLAANVFCKSITI